MSTKDHGTTATELIKDAEDADPDSTYNDMSMLLQFAQAHATLALAGEQRTANLIALYALPVSDWENLPDGCDRAVLAGIVAALGLTEATS